MRTCLCGHDAADHHLDRMAVECWGELAYAINDAKTDGFHVEHCVCTVYDPAFSSLSLS